LAKRVAIALPIWGISAIAVGSIGAPLPRETVAEARRAEAVAAPKLPKATPEAAQPKTATRRYATLTMPKRDNGRLAFDREALSIPAAMMAATPVAPLLAQKPARAAAAPAPAVQPQSVVAAAPAVAVAVPAPALVQPKAAAVPATPRMPEALPTVQQAVPVRNALGEAGRRDSQSLYGTGARNAYKVYFPQIDEPANAVAKRFDDAAAAQGDDRVLRKDGDGYYHYDRPEKAASPATANAKADPAAAKPLKKEVSLESAASADASLQKQIDSLLVARQQKPVIQ
jgi:hypothetical protein